MLNFNDILYIPLPLFFYNYYLPVLWLNNWELILNIELENINNLVITNCKEWILYIDNNNKKINLQWIQIKTKLLLDTIILNNSEFNWLLKNKQTFLIESFKTLTSNNLNDWFKINNGIIKDMFIEMKRKKINNYNIYDK